MDEKSFEALAASMEDALGYAKGDKSRGKVTEYPDVAEIRKGLGLSQGKFAVLFEVNVTTLRNWEQGRRTPDGPARSLLKVISRNPKAVLQALKDEAG